MSDDSSVELPSLRSGASDYIASATKAALSVVPFAGSLLAEIAGTIIPNQRIERLVKYAEALDRRLSELDRDFVRSQLASETFTDTMEEGMRQAARSLSDERREYLAAAVANGLSQEDIEHSEAKHLLRILGEINDTEVLILRFHLVPTIGGDEEFREKHGDVVIPPIASIGSSQAEHDKFALHQSYTEHLTSLGLLERHYKTNTQTGQLEIDSLTGGLKVRGHGITMLGRLLLRKIELADEDGEPIAPTTQG